MIAVGFLLYLTFLRFSRSATLLLVVRPSEKHDFNCSVIENISAFSKSVSAWCCKGAKNHICMPNSANLSSGQGTQHNLSNGKS